MDFPNHDNQAGVIHYKRIGYSANDVIRQAALVFEQCMLPSLITRRWVGNQTP